MNGRQQMLLLTNGTNEKGLKKLCFELHCLGRLH